MTAPKILGKAAQPLKGTNTHPTTSPAVVLGDVPEHWELERGKTLFTKVDRPVRESDDVVTCFRDGTVTLRKNRRTQGFTESLKEIGYQGIREGDLVIHAMDAFAGAVGVSDSNGKGTPVYAVCEPKPKAYARYHAMVIREMARSQWILALATGIRERSTDFRFGTYARQRVPVPPLDEQAAVVRYLDHVDGRVRRLVRAKRKLIDLLTEQKQAIIHHRAVTRGLDPDVPLKDSGVEWLGQVPDHWGFNRGKYYFDEADVRSTTGEEELLSVSHITGVTPRRQKNVTMFKAASYEGSKVCRPGQIAVNTMWAWMAAMGVSRFHGIVSPAYHIYERLDPASFLDEYLDLLLRSDVYKTLYTISSRGITSSRLRLYPDDFLNLRFLCPPIDEQKAIVLWLSENTVHIDRTVARASREIELLDEFRSRLIADVVTGKLDVREAAAALPDVEPVVAAVDLDDALDIGAEDDFEGFLQETEA